MEDLIDISIWCQLCSRHVITIRGCAPDDWRANGRVVQTQWHQHTREKEHMDKRVENKIFD